MKGASQRITKLEERQKARTSFGGFQVCILPDGCQDEKAFWERCGAEALAAGRQVLRIEFIEPFKTEARPWP